MRLRWVRRISSGAAAIAFCALSAAVCARGQASADASALTERSGRRLAGAAGAAFRQPHGTAEPGVDARGGGGDPEHALCFGGVPAHEPRRPHVRAGPPGAAAGISAFAGERAEAGADAGRRFDCGGQLYRPTEAGLWPRRRWWTCPNLRMLPEVTARGEMQDMIAVFSELAWKLTKQLDPQFNVAEETFAAAGKEYPAGRVRAVHSRHHGAGPGGAAAAPGKCGEAEPGLRPGVDGAGPRRLQRAAVPGGGRGLRQGGSQRARRAGGGFLPRAFADVSRATTRTRSRRLPRWRAFCRWPRW